MRRPHHALLVVALAGCAWSAASNARSADDDACRDRPLQPACAIDDAALDGLRGGFETGAGLQVAFGIERAIYVNGSLVSTTRLNLADGRASASTDATSLGLVQNGPNNAFGTVTSAASSVATVIQNSLDHQTIQGITTINASVSSLEVMKRAGVQLSIQNALAGSIRR